MKWKPVVGYEGQYEVSDCGRVRSLDRTIACVGRWGKKEVRSYKGQILKSGIGSHGCPVVSLCKSESKLVHRLMLEAFVGPCPDGMESCHNNGIRSDCRLENIRWDTISANQMDKVGHGTSNRGERQGNSKLTEWDIRWIKRFQEHGFATQSYLAEIFNVSMPTMSDIKSGRRWGWLEV